MSSDESDVIVVETDSEDEIMSVSDGQPVPEDTAPGPDTVGIAPSVGSPEPPGLGQTPIDRHPTVADTGRPSQAPRQLDSEGRPSQAQAPRLTAPSQLDSEGRPSQAQAPRLTAPTLLDSPADFRSPKRRRVLSDQQTTESTVAASDVEDSECCPICFENWTTSGNHRLCSLKCGHLFGQSCIEKWLSGQNGKCPQCNAKAKRQHIRVLYAKSIKVLDTCDRDRAVADLQRERSLRREADMAAAQLRLQHQLAVEETNRLQTELQQLRSHLAQPGGSSTTASVPARETTPRPSLTMAGPSSSQFVPDRAIKIWEAGGCRVLAYSATHATLVVSQPSASPLFPGYGVKKISTLDMKSSEYLTIHSKAVRDLAFHPAVDEGILLSCGLDRKVKMTSLNTNAVVQAYNTDVAAWSCVWNADDSNYFYAGLQNGVVLEFDVRNTSGSVQDLTTAGSRSPVVALRYMPRNMHTTFRPGGVLIGQLDRVSFFESVTSDQHRPHLLQLEGSLTSLYIDERTRHFLASFRPTARHPSIRHELCELVSRNVSTDPSTVNTACICRTVSTFRGGHKQTVLSRGVLVPQPAQDTRLLVCAGDEERSTVNVWDSGSCDLKQRLVGGGLVLDMCPVYVNNTLHLATLTERQLKLFRWS